MHADNKMPLATNAAAVPKSGIKVVSRNAPLTMAQARIRSQMPADLRESENMASFGEGT